MKKIYATLASFVILFSITSYAQETPLKEDTTPPPPEGALTLEQIPPININSSNVNKLLTQNSGGEEEQKPAAG